jgi:hypothetical protein
MASRILPTGQSILEPKRVVQKTYTDFIRTLPCVVTGYIGEGVEAAHVSTRAVEWGHMGRGMSGKASDMWTLPLHRDQHWKQGNMHGNSGAAEMGFWIATGIHPHRLCAALYGAWNCYGQDDAWPVCKQIIERARDL